ALAPVADADDEAGHGPDRRVVAVLGAAGPGDAGLQQARVGGPGLQRAPADGLVVEEGDQAGRRLRGGGAARRLRAQHRGARLIRDRVPVPHADLVPLAVAVGGVAAEAEDLLHFGPGHFVGRKDRERHAAEEYARTASRTGVSPARSSSVWRTAA